MSESDAQRKRKTLTILAMDVVGYSEKMSSDEENTVRQLDACRKIVEETVKTHQGRIFNTAGDSFMVEFNSTLGAVRSALEIQESISKHNLKEENGQGLEFRMGVNMGDVVVDGDNLLGDGVNVAARLEGIAPPGGICVSEIVHSVVKGKVNCGFFDKGNQNLKNIAEPVRAYFADIATGSVDPKKFKSQGSNKSFRYFAIAAALVVGVGIYLLQSGEKEVKSEADFRRIAISPFDAGSEDQALLNFATGLTEDLNGGLASASKNLTLITLTDPPEDLRQLFTDFNTRYFISGSVRRSGASIRISVNLMDTKSLGTVWSERYDKEFTAVNIFSLQDEIVGHVIDALVGNGAVLAQEVVKNVSTTGTKDLTAYECVNFVRGQYFKVLSPQLHAQGVDCLRKSVIDDPQYKEAWALLAHMLAWGYSLYVPFFQSVDKAGLSEAFDAVDNAIRIDKNYARAYATRAELHFYERDWEPMMVNARRAFELAPRDAYTVGHLSYLVVESGAGCKKPQAIKAKFGIDDRACKRLDWGYELALKAHDLDAISSMTFDNYGLGNYYLETAEWDKQLAIFEQVPTPDFHWWNIQIGMAHHQLGNLDRARSHFDAALKQYLNIPGRPLSNLKIGLAVWNMDIQYPLFGEVLSQYGWH